MIRKLKKGDLIRFKDGGWIKILEGRVKIEIAVPEKVKIVSARQSRENTDVNVEAQLGAKCPRG